MSNQPEPRSLKGLHFGTFGQDEVKKPPDDGQTPKRDSPPISGQQVYGLQDDPV